MTSKEKIKEILGWIQYTTDADWNFLMCLKQDLECLATIAQTEGIIEVRNAMDEVWKNNLKGSDTNE